MRKVLVFFILLLLFSFKTLALADEKPSCTAKATPSEGVAGETRFSISGNVNSLPSKAHEVTLNVIDTKKTYTVQSFPISLTLDPANSGPFGPIELDPFYLPSIYVANIYYVTTVRGTISHFLCSSNTFTVNPSLTPTKLECNPPGRDPKDQSKCSDPRCTPTGRYQCILNAIAPPTPTPTPPPPPCAKYDDKGEKCIAVNTAIGEISTEPQGFVKRIFSLVLGIAGGIALILIILSGYKMMASQGNPEAVQAARDQLISAIVGLLFIIFSFVILQVIGVDILRIPGFSE